MAARKKKVAKKKTSKKTGKKMAVRGKKELATESDVEKMLSGYASNQSARETLVGSSKLSTKNGKFFMGDTNLGEEIDVIIVAFAAENRYYDSPYDEDNPSSPTCFAVGNCSEMELVPHENSLEVQADKCADCELNAWGSAESGRGKACSNRRRILLLDAEEEDFSQAEMVELNIGPSSLNNWKSYIKEVNDKLGLPSFGVVTTLTLDEDVDYPVFQFDVKEKITKKAPLSQIIDRLEEGETQSLRPYDPASFADDEDTPPSRGKKKAKKKAKKKGGKFR